MPKNTPVEWWSLLLDTTVTSQLYFWLFCTTRTQIIETMPHTENVEEFLEKLGDFYELVDNEVDGPVAQMMKRNSPLRRNSDMTNGVTSHSTLGSESSPETSDTLHPDSNSTSHSIIGL